jgi:hypothetical protein
VSETTETLPRGIRAVSPVTQVDQEVAGLLGGPGAVGVGGGAEDVDVAGGDFEHEGHVDPLEGDRAVYGGEVTGQD